MGPAPLPTRFREHCPGEVRRADPDVDPVAFHLRRLDDLHIAVSRHQPEDENAPLGVWRDIELTRQWRSVDWMDRPAVPTG